MVAARLVFPTRSSGRKAADHRSFRRSISTASAQANILKPNMGRKVCSAYFLCHSNAMAVLGASGRVSNLPVFFNSGSEMTEFKFPGRRYHSQRFSSLTTFFFFPYEPPHPMPFPDFVDPPTKETLAGARRSLEVTRASVDEITSKIDAAEIALAQLVRDSRLAIDELEGQRAALEDQVSRTLAYLSPIRRLPMELLREIFVWSFEEHACSAWVLAAVCPSWRRLALRIPLIWSKVSPFYAFRDIFSRSVFCYERFSRFYII